MRTRRCLRRSVVPAAVPRLAVGLVLASGLTGCGTSSGPQTDPRASVAALDAALAAHHDRDACRLLGPIPQAVLIRADARATGATTCVQALGSAGTRRVLAQFPVPATDLGRDRMTSESPGVVLLQSDRPLPVTVTLTRGADGRWLITGL